MFSSVPLGGGGSPTVSNRDISLSIPMDVNWIPFQDHLQQSIAIPEEIEINVFKSGAAIPVYSLKLKGGINVLSVQISGGGVYALVLLPEIIGIKHHPSGKSIGFNLQTGAHVPY